LVTTELETTVG